MKTQMLGRLVHDLTESFQYNLIKSTVNLAKEKGACEYSSNTKYSQGYFPIDTYKKDVDELVPNNLKYDWDSSEDLSKNTELETALCQHKCLRRAVRCVCNATNGIEPPRGYFPLRSQRKGLLSKLFLNMVFQK